MLSASDYISRILAFRIIYVVRSACGMVPQDRWPDVYQLALDAALKTKLITTYQREHLVIRAEQRESEIVVNLGWRE